MTAYAVPAPRPGDAFVVRGDEGGTIFGVVLAFNERHGMVLADVDSARARGVFRAYDVIVGREALERFRVTSEQLQLEHEIAEAREACGYTEVC